MSRNGLAQVLVVEDVPAVRRALAACLEAGGYSVACAANGAEALEAMKGANLPDVVLLDLQMPVVDGWEFRRRQLAEPRLARVPVVLLTASEPGPDPLWAGVARLTKTCGLAELLGALARICLGGALPLAVAPPTQRRPRAKRR